MWENMPWAKLFELEYGNNIVKSVLFILFLIVCRAVILRMLALNKKIGMETMRRWAVNLRNAVLVLSLIGMFTIWSQQLANFALSMVAVAMALVIATKELIMCVAGSFLRTITNSYTLGDHIEVGPYRGLVVDIDVLSTTIMELGPDHLVHQFTGKAISLPNSLLLTHSVIRENYMGEYVVHTITIPVANEIDVQQCETVLMQSTQEICAPFLEDARRHMLRIEKRHLVDTPSVDPRIAIRPIDEKHYVIIVRIAIPASERHRVEQAILHRFMRATYSHSVRPAADR